uniref:Uncharacterized protein n=1 Tax=Anopheles quadriannulatus TaxID=34691 RepID=A0A182XDD5_ANOQN
MYSTAADSRACESSRWMSWAHSTLPQWPCWNSSSNRASCTAFSIEMYRSAQAIVKMMDLIVSTANTNPCRAAVL